MKQFFIALAALLFMMSCTNEKKILVLYYSQTGVTKAVAEEIQAQTGADICSFDVEQVYDGTYDETIQRCLKERQSGFVPDLKPLDRDLSKYDVIFLGYPIWFGSFAPPVQALLATGDLNGKTIVPFCTFGSGGLYSSIDDLKALVYDSEILEGYGVRAARIAAAPAELNRFLIENAWKTGKVEPLPEYSDAAELTEEEMAIFDAACSSYTYPLGTPITVASRKTSTSVDYLYVVESVSAEGSKVESKVYVTVQDGQAPEFTIVVR